MILKFIKINNLIKYIKFNKKKVLILTSRFHIKNKSILKLISDLNKIADIKIYNNISPGASVEDIKIILKNYDNPDLIVGIGGGSVMDISKACSCFFGSKILYKNIANKKIKKKIKTILIPTILGSGAEISRGAILKKKDKKKIAIRHDLVRADKVFVDIDMIKTSKLKIKCEALYDCLSHALETYISNFSTLTVKKRSISAIRFLLKIRSKEFFKKNHNLRKLAISSYLMGVNLSESTTCLPHRIQYSLSRLTNSSHAQCIIALHKGWLLCSKDTLRFNQLSSKLGISSDKLYKNIIKLRKILKIDYRLKDIGIFKKNFLNIVKFTDGTLDADPFFLEKNSIIRILKNSL